MKSRHRIEDPRGVTSFDLTAPIIPAVGAGGIAFSNSLTDFEFLLTEKFFDAEMFPDVSSEIDTEYLLMTLKVNATSLSIQFDILSGAINYICCGSGYSGDYNGTLRIGAI